MSRGTNPETVHRLGLVQQFEVKLAEALKVKEAAELVLAHAVWEVSNTRDVLAREREKIASELDPRHRL
ncbi:hypothetical protein [Microbacterium maritypicum]